MAKLISKIYGDALFELALEENKLDLFYNESKLIRQVFLDNSELIKLLNHPKIDSNEKKSVIENIFKDKVTDEFVGFLVLILQKERQKKLIDILDYFISQVKEYKKIGVAYITSASQLNEIQKSEVEKKLLETNRYKQFEMNYVVDPSLIGGMTIRIGNRVVDNSIKHRLHVLENDLYEIKLVN